MQLSFLLLFVTVVVIVNGQQQGNDPSQLLPSQNVLDQLGQRITKDLVSLINEASGREELAKKYTSQIFYIEPVHGEDVLEEAIEKLEPLFQRRVKAVEEIARKAEQLAMAHDYVEEPEMSRVQFVNGRDWENPILMMADGNDSSSSSIVNRHFGRSMPVVLNTSAVHIPMQVYEGWMWHRFKPIWYEDFDTVNALMWSSRLDDVFVDNMKRDPTLHWQYFASREGLLRYFPAHKWKTNVNQHDTFDARQRPWFQQSIASAKDLIILMDVSGSIHGPTFEILKITVKRLLGSLTQYDYFNVLQFNETVSMLLPCSDSLMPATTKNKRLVYQALDHIVPLGRASLANAINFTHNFILELDGKKVESSNCQLAVVLISDGGTEFPAEQVELMTNHSTTRQTRVFTLAVGPHPIPTLNLRNISCSTKAFHGAILTYGAIPGKVQGYLQVLSRPLALSQNDALVDWSLSYKDASGVGAVISITKPVYQRGGNLSQSLLGVAGVDIPISTFDQALPGSQLGFGGYKMAVMPTGYAVIHPKLEQQHSYVDDPLMVDYEDLEPEGEWSSAFRRKLMDGKNGSQSYNPVTSTPDNAYVIGEKRTWFFRPIAKTPYRLAVSVKEGANIILPNLELQGKVPWVSQLMTRAAPWSFCNHLRANLSLNARDSAADYFNKLSERFERGGEDCDQTALSHLMWDLEMTSNVSHSWPASDHRRFHSRFVVTTGGITRMEPRTRSYIQEDLVDPRNSSTFMRLSSSANTSILIRPPSGRGDDYLIAAKISSKDQLLAVTGALTGKDAIQSIWLRALGQLNISDQSNVYWLDEGGYVIAANQLNIAPGSFLGASRADPQLMQGLISTVYEKKTILKSGLNCPVFVKTAPISSAPLLSAKWITNLSGTAVSAASFFYTLVLSLLWGASTASGFHDAMELDKLRPAKVDNNLCTKEYVLYQLKSSRQLILNLPCSGMCSITDGSSRRVIIRPMTETNSILVVATPPCRCSNPIIHHGLIRVDNDMEKCQVYSRYRKPSKQCFANDPRENSLECSGYSIHGAVYMLPSMVATFIIIWILR